LPIKRQNGKNANAKHDHTEHDNTGHDNTGHDNMTMIASDLEGTLTTGRTWQALADYLAKHGAKYGGAWRYRRNFWWRYPIVAATKVPPIGQRVDVPALQRQWMIDLLMLFAGASKADFADIAAWVVEHHLWPKRREDVLEHISSYSGKLIVASGAYQPVVQAFADRLGAEAIGTPLELTTVCGERFLTGKTAGAINTADAKQQRLEQHLQGRVLEVALGDTGEDIPMLAWSHTPVAVYPDKILATKAQQDGWRVFPEP
jgi:phosphoserine phosphatase